MRSELWQITVAVTIALVGCTSVEHRQGVDHRPKIGHLEKEDARRTHSVELRLKWEPAEDGMLEIDTDHHETVEVFRGERVEWSCACPEGTEFTIDVPTLLRKLEEPKGKHSPSETHSPEEIGELTDPKRREERSHPLFGDWRRDLPQRERWVDAGQTITSPVVAPGPIHHGLWKFTWRVRWKDKPNTEAVWDPHIFGHTSKFSE